MPFDGLPSKQIRRRQAFHPLNPKFETAAPQRKADLKQEARVLALQRLREQLLLPLLGLLLLVGLLAAAWVVSRDQRGEGVSAASELSPEEFSALKSEVDQRERNFTTLVQRKATIAEDDLGELEAAVAAQERLIAAAGISASESARLDNLRTRLHIYRAERLRESSLALEKESEQARDAGNQEVAVAKLGQALALEQAIREKWMLSNLEDNGRIARLDIRMRRLQADPIWEASRRLEREAEEHVGQGRFAEAEKSLLAAIETERDFALRFRDVRATEIDRAEKLQRRLETLRSASLKAKVDESVSTAAAAEAAREWARAAELWSGAARQMGELIERHPFSLHADRKSVQNYLRRQSLALAMPEVEKFRTGMEEVRSQLRAGDTSQASVLVSSLAARLTLLLQQFPEALPAADPDRRQLEVIRERVSTLGLVRESFIGQLLPLPGGTGRRILRTEVPQSLYQAVIGINPSAKREPNLPVESLSHAEAEEFARRLGWLTGLRVRLPTQEEFLAAHGDLARPVPSDEAWIIDNSDGRVRPVGTAKPNPAGLHDLVGNVGEWLAAEPSAPSALVAGGDAQSATRQGVSLDLAGKTDLSRLRGFRVVVDP